MVKMFIKDTGNDYLHILFYKYFLNLIKNYFNESKYNIKQKHPKN